MSLEEQASALLRKVEDGDTSEPSGSTRLAPEDRALILRLAAKGNLAQAEIAKAVGCSQPTVSRVLTMLDTRAEARVILDSGAARLATTVVNTDDAAIALKALGRIDVVRDHDGVTGSGVTINIGTLPPPDIEVQVVRATVGLDGNEPA